jgi:transketolase
MRAAFIDSLLDLRSRDNEVMLLVADLGYSVVEPFVDRYPRSFINIGVAEQNMAGIAAGLASEGYLPFCYSIGNFNTFRCAEQIRNDIDYHGFPVCTVSVGGGVAYGNMGYSHHAIQDYALMRSMPNTLICAPADPKECSLLMSLIHSRRQPTYLRLHKQGEPIITKENETIIPGLPRFYGGDPKSKIALLSTGFTAQGLYQRYAHTSQFSLFTMPAWGMAFRTPIKSWIRDFDRLIVVEDHLLDGGFSSWILESLVGTVDIAKVRSVYLPESVIGYVATEEKIHDQAKLFDIDLLRSKGN